MALLRHSGIYFLARILAGGAGFAIIAAYTRLLDAHQFGELALALAGVNFFSGIIIYGVMHAMIRYLPAHSEQARATTLWGLILPVAALCCVSVVVFLIVAPESWRVQLALCAGLLLATALHQFQLASAQGALQSRKYALLGSLESLLDMMLGIAFVWLGYGVAGALLGTMLATLITVAVNCRGWWINWTFFDPALGRQMVHFGLPLIATTLCSWLATFADRWLLAGYVGADYAGLYAAGYDLQMNLLGVPLAVILLAGYPLAISAYTERGTQAAQDQLRLLGAFVILIVLPEAVGIVMTGPLLVTIFLGAEFRPLSLSLLPILVGATFLKVLMYYVNCGYALASRTSLTMLSMAAAAAVDLILNIVLIPHYGAWGAAVAALVGFGAGLAIAVVKMGGVFPFPRPDAAVVGAGLLGVAAMAAFLALFYRVTSLGLALYIIPAAIAIYLGCAFLVLHFAGRNPLDLMRSLWLSERKGAGL